MNDLTNNNIDVHQSVHSILFYKHNYETFHFQMLYVLHVVAAISAGLEPWKTAQDNTLVNNLVSTITKLKAICLTDVACISLRRDS